MTSRSLNDALVVITGASSGIGRAAAHAFASAGARLVLASRDGETLERVADECRANGAAALAVPTDVTIGQEVQRLGDTAAEFGQGHIDVWVNNAGVGAVGAFDETPLEAHEQIVQTDLIGYLRGAHVALPFFKAQGSGVLINTLSVGSWVAQPYAVAYSASKYGLRGFSEALRGELVNWPGIHVCDVYPAVMDTPGFRDAGNFTGHALQPPAPIYDPRLVADAMVDLARRPRHTRTVGSAAALLRLGHFLLPKFPELSGLITGFAIHRARSGSRTDGNLFLPPTEERSIDGGWRRTNGDPDRIALGVLAVLGVGCLVAYALHRRRH